MWGQGEGVRGCGLGVTREQLGETASVITTVKVPSSIKKE